MLSKRIISFIENKFFSSWRRSFTQPAGTVSGLTLQVHKGSEEVDETLDFLEATFVKDEAIVSSFDIQDTCDLLRFLKHQVCQGWVVKFVTEECEVVSAGVCVPVTPDSPGKMRTFAECSTCDFKTKRLINFWADVADSHNLFECFKTQEIWDIRYLTTTAAGKGKGLGKIIIAESKLLGKKEGFSICRMDCTNHLTAKLADSMKFVTLPPRNALTFRDKKGCPWVPRKPPHPHGHVVITYDFLC